MILPFGALLAAIALAPLFFADWWTRHYPKVAFVLAAITLTYYLVFLPALARSTVLHTAEEYVSFIVLIGALFVVSGGIHITVKGEATPHVNVLFLLIGAVLANLLGTTGASMLLIRPWLRMNKYRITAHHVVFFIFIVSNVGGCLTPIGDPPLFLGYLRGVPFWWVAEFCWPAWLTGVGILLAMFYVVDRRNYTRAPREVRAAVAEPPDTWRFDGLHNVFFLAVILGAVFVNRPRLLREGLMIAAAAASWFTTHQRVHDANHFNFHPIQEVAILFVGIFATMMPALEWLKANTASMERASPAHFYWGTGVLSSVLDNAPTYLSFLSMAEGRFGSGVTGVEPVSMGALLANPEFARALVAISVGAVFFGANTYIGNGPNFMVKAIADHQKVHSPTFLGYIFKFTLPYMLPTLALVWWLYFRR